MKNSAGKFILKFDNRFDITITVKKSLIQKAECSCAEKGLCEHIVTSLFIVRKSLSTPSKKPRLNNEKFIASIEGEELRLFVLNQMKTDKNFKILFKARFVVEIEGVQKFEPYLNSAFPPAKTTKVTPAQSEVKLFKKVCDEIYDQVKDLIGRDNYVDAISILVPLIKKSFYFKNRFEEPSETFLKTHLHLVEVLYTLHEAIEAPKLKTDNVKNIVSLLDLSYVTLNHKEEKKLLLNLTNTSSNRKKIKAILSKKVSSSTSELSNFLFALRYACDGSMKLSDKDVGRVFIEIQNWHLWDPTFFDTLLSIASEYKLPPRFSDKLFYSSSKDEKTLLKQKELALKSIINSKSYNAYTWLYKEDKDYWLKNRKETIQTLHSKSTFQLLLKILKSENDIDSFFQILMDQSDHDLNFQFLSNALDLSFEKTLILYKKEIDHYLDVHFGEKANDNIRRTLSKVGMYNHKLRDGLAKHVQKFYGKRRSIKLEE